jgi:N-acyl homoserine lactone hydrolase
MSQIKVHPLNLGTITRQVAVFCQGLEQGVLADLPVIGWYIEGAGKKILIDTGGGDPAQASPRWMPYKRENDQSIENALGKIGVKCEDIDLVIITHIHWDHACGNLAFPKTKLIVQTEELQYARSQPADAPGVCPPAILAMDYETVTGDVEVARGVKVILTPGHTHGMQGVLIKGAERDIYIAGDNLPLFKNLEGNPFTMTNIFVDLDKYQKSLKKIANLSAFILPSHDKRVFEKQIYM